MFIVALVTKLRKGKDAPVDYLMNGLWNYDVHIYGHICNGEEELNHGICRNMDLENRLNEKTKVHKMSYVLAYM